MQDSQTFAALPDLSAYTKHALLTVLMSSMIPFVTMQAPAVWR